MKYDTQIIAEGIDDRKIKYLVTEKTDSELQAIAISRWGRLDLTLKPWELAVEIVKHDNQIRDFMVEGKTAEIVLGLHKGVVGKILAIDEEKRSFKIEYSPEKFRWFYYYEILFTSDSPKEKNLLDELHGSEVLLLGKNLREVFRGDFLRDMALDLSPEQDRSIRHQKSLYIEILCSHFNNIGEVYLYLARKQKESEVTL